MLMLRLFLLVLFLLISIPHFTSAQTTTYYALWDRKGSSIVGGEGLLSLHKIIKEYGDKKLPPTYWEKNWQDKTIGIGYRLAKTVLLDRQIRSLIWQVQHEVFGHGYRYREFGFQNSSYRVRLVLPWPTKGGVFARRGDMPNGHTLGMHEGIAIFLGGMEANSLLAKSIQNRWLQSGQIHYDEGRLYVSTSNDYISYILKTRFYFAPLSGNDVQNFLREVNESKGYLTKEDFKLTLNGLAKRTAIQLLNPYQFFGWYAHFRYLIAGKLYTPLPMINVGDKIKWLPAVRLGLTPFGSEWIVENHVVYNSKNIFELSFKNGDNLLYQYWGAGLKMQKHFSDFLMLESSMDLWNQPSLSLGGPIAYETKGGIGGRITANFHWLFDKQNLLGIYGLTGYKTAGFIPGEQLEKNFIFRIGLVMGHQVRH